MALAIDTLSPLETGSKDLPYSEDIQSSGGTGPFQWSLQTGTLPDGLNLDLASVADKTTLSGTPLRFGTYTFTVRCKDALNVVVDKAFTITIEEKPQLVTFSDKVIDPATRKGVQLTGLTIEIYNSRYQLQETLVFPAGISEEFSNADGYSYKVVNFNITDDAKWGPFLHVKYFATVAAGAVEPWWQIIQIGQTQLPDIPATRTPYAQLAEADEYFKTKLSGRHWRKFDQDVPMQLLALVEASDHIDREKFKGYKIRVFEGTTVSRQFPRYLPNEEIAGGFFSDLNKIPVQVRQACAEQALWLLQEEANGHDWQARAFLQSAGLTSIQRGDNVENWDLAAAKHSQLCPEALRLLQPFLAVYADDTAGLL